MNTVSDRQAIDLVLPSGHERPLAAALRNALNRQPLKPRQPIRLIDPDAWCQELTLDARQVAGGTEESVGWLLAYEAEAFSALPPAQALVGFRREAAHGAEAVFTAVEFPAAEVREAAKVAKAAGHELVALTHPELAAAGVVLVPPPEPVTVSTRCRRALGWTIAVLVVVGVATGLLAHRNAGLKVRLAELERLRDECAAVEARAAADRAAAADRRRRLEAEVRGELRQLRARRSFSRILEALAATCPEGGMIRSLRSEGDYQLAVEGVTATNTDAEEFLRRLGEVLKRGGFAVATLSLDSMNQLPGGGPWSFRCRIRPVPGEVGE